MAAYLDPRPGNALFYPGAADQDAVDAFYDAGRYWQFADPQADLADRRDWVEDRIDELADEVEALGGEPDEDGLAAQIATGEAEQARLAAVVAGGDWSYATADDPDATYYEFCGARDLDGGQCLRDMHASALHTGGCTSGLIQDAQDGDRDARAILRGAGIAW